MKMVGIFSKFSVNKVGHRRSQSALDEREIVPPNSEATTAVTLTGATSVTAHGIEVEVEVEVEFKPVEYPIEPLDNDCPIHCPLPEPSILNVCSKFCIYRASD